MGLEFVHTGQYTVVHYQCYQMVDLLTQCCRKMKDGLNPYAVPYAPSTSQIVTEESTNNKKNNNNNVEPSKWHTCETKKGWKQKNNNKNKREKKTKSFGNRFSRLQEMVQDNHEVTEAIEKAVDEDKLQDTIKNENEQNKHNVDSVEIHTLDAEIQKCMEQDNNEGIQQKMNENETTENNSNATDADLDVNKNESNEESEHDSEKERLEYRLMHPDSDSERNEDSECDSEKERLECRLMRPDSDSACSDSDESVASNFELWNDDRVRCMLETYSE